MLLLSTTEYVSNVTSYAPTFQPPDFNKIWKTFWHKFANYKCVEPHVLTAVSKVGVSHFNLTV